MINLSEEVQITALIKLINQLTKFHLIIYQPIANFAPESSKRRWLGKETEIVFMKWIKVLTYKLRRL